ncbi:hypothetical protein D0865_00387 [Hortaea werneckii]|uniref:Uncharacterized protein n=1 Tax=Hortaea werneckii TaxID=91943 RepID=A0A3M7DF08_HORWE|nr:hypothetical protein D0865_00387 [Hortaea werneckii]
MSQPPNQPKLTPQLCFNQTALREPERPRDTGTSRAFDPASTATSSTAQPPRPIYRRPIDADACQSFKHRVLFPSWQSRSDLLNYCAGVATSPDPDDPDHLLRQSEDLKARERLVDERLDPYSARYFPQEARTEALANLIRNERMVESIIRNRTWALVGERCENLEGDYEKALDAWRRGDGTAKAELKSVTCIIRRSDLELAKE